MYQVAANNRVRVQCWFIVMKQLSVVIITSEVKSFAAACRLLAPAVWGWVDPQVGKAIFGGEKNSLTHCGRVTQICVFNTVKLGTSASSP